LKNANPEERLQKTQYLADTLAAPTTPDVRLKRILNEADGFLYVVSVAGVTGARKDLSSQVKPLVQRIKKQSGGLPLAVGFGISNPIT